MPFQQGHAILIGVGSHQYLPRLDVPISVTDAQAVADVLQNPGYCGYPGEQVRVLSHASATTANILSELDSLAQRVKNTDTVTFFYEGHGDYGDDGNYYLITHDAQASGDKVVPGTGLSQAALLDALRKLPAERILLIFNACHAGELAPVSFGTAAPAESGVAFGAQTLPNVAADALLSTGSGRIILGACREDQRSYIGNGKLSLFTQALVDALQGRGLLPRGGFINLFDLYISVYETVRDKALMTLGREQHPELTVLKGVGPFAVALFRGASQTDLSLAEAPQEPPSDAAVRQTPPEKSQRLYKQFVVQTGGINFGQGNQINIGGDVIGTQETVHASGSKGFIYKPTGPVEQVFGDKVAGDKIAADKVLGDKITGDVSRRDRTGAAGEASLEQFLSLLSRLRKGLQAAGLPAMLLKQVEIFLFTVEADAQGAEPSRESIQTSLGIARIIVDNAVETGNAPAELSDMIHQANELAGQIFN